MRTRKLGAHRVRRRALRLFCNMHICHRMGNCTSASRANQLDSWAEHSIIGAIAIYAFVAV